MHPSVVSRALSWASQPRLRMLRRVAAAALIVALPMGGCGGGGAGEPSGADYVLDPQKAHYGASFALWSQRFWQWCYELPVTDHPLFDATGVNAARGQTDPVWFIGGEFGSTNTNVYDGIVTRTISIPSGVALFFPLVNVSMTNQECVEPDTNYTYTELRELAAAGVEGAVDLFCAVDGDVVLDSPTFAGAVRYRAQTEEFSYHLPVDSMYVPICNDLVVDVIHSPVAGDGIYMMLAPLPVGTHTLRFGGAFPAWSFVLDVQYTIHVVAP